MQELQAANNQHFRAQNTGYASVLDPNESAFLDSFFDGDSRETSGFPPPDFYPENISEAATIGSKENSGLKVARRELDWMTPTQRNDFERLRPEAQGAAQDSTPLGLPQGLKHGEKVVESEVFDPLNWMLDGLVDFPYSYAAIQGLDGTAPAGKV
ncbi:hypothetical protein V8E51_004221 [Hyaloscypha variabilis]